MNGGRPEICLAMLVRDESDVIERCLRSVAPHIDSWIIVNAGSSDEMSGKIANVLGTVPGSVVHRPFVAFDDNRTELMELVYERGPDWALLMDAEMVLEVQGDLHDAVSEFQDREALLVEVRGRDIEVPMPQIVRGTRHWRYEGAAHEVLTTAGRPRSAITSRVRVRDLADSRSRLERLEQDKDLLEKRHEQTPQDPRTTFYLAQTYRDLGRTDVALRLYAERANTTYESAWDEETFYAQYQLGVLQADRNWPLAVDAFIRAWSMRPTHAEPSTSWRSDGGIARRGRLPTSSPVVV